VPAPVTPAPIVSAAPVTPPARPAIELAAANARPASMPATDLARPTDKTGSVGTLKATATVEATVAGKQIETPEWAKDWSPAKDAQTPAKPAEKTTEVVPHADDTPVGDWQTEGRKGLVRIEQCGASLCGYVLDEFTNETGETVLSNMKPKNDTQWSGDIYSRTSGNTYYARMTFKQSDTLRVEACAIGHFFCTGNDWTRVVKPDNLMSSRNLPEAPKS
jgi:uncharacterized protein (DUF2147 family)